MISILKNQRGMNLIGQGWKIILFMLPSLIASIWVHRHFPRIAALPDSFSFIKPMGYVLVFLGLILWVTALIQLLSGFSRNRLITTGAYGLVRNPLYSSATFFIFPGVSVLTLTWVYLAVSVFLYIGVITFIGREENQLRDTFGREYEEYLAKVDRLVPLKKPSRRKCTKEN